MLMKQGLKAFSSDEVAGLRITIASAFMLPFLIKHYKIDLKTNLKGLLLMGGDCAEALEEFNVDHVRDSFRVLLQMTLVLTFGSKL